MVIIIAYLIIISGREDTIDNCPLISNPSQADTDGDNIGDLCDNCVKADPEKIEQLLSFTRTICVIHTLSHSMSGQLLILHSTRVSFRSP
jgi:hypothetical protein